MTHGYIEEKRDREDYVFGGAVRLAGVPLVPDGQWDAFVPTDEFQNLNGVEPYACVSFGTLNAIEILERREYGDTSNYSDRFLAKITGTEYLKGNTANRVSETLRKRGVPEEQYWPFSPDVTTFQKFYADIPGKVFVQANEFLAEYDFGHEWVNGDPASMMQALQYSPLGVSVDAWHLNSDGTCFRSTSSDNHWCTIYGYSYNNYWKVFDSYDNSHKRLAWDFGFTSVKRYTLHKQVVNDGAFARFVFWLKSLWVS